MPTDEIKRVIITALKDHYGDDYVNEETEKSIHVVDDETDTGFLVSIDVTTW